MSKAELGNDPSTLEDTADKGHALAQALHGEAEACIRSLYSLEWSGPRADAFRERAASEIKAISRETTSLLSSIASQLRFEAGQQRQASAGHGGTPSHPAKYQSMPIHPGGGFNVWGILGLLGGIKAAWNFAKTIRSISIAGTRIFGAISHGQFTNLVAKESSRFGSDVTKILDSDFASYVKDGVGSDKAGFLAGAGRVIGIAGIAYGTYQTIDELSKGHYGAATADAVGTIGGALMMVPVPGAQVIGGVLVVGSLVYQHWNQIAKAETWLVDKEVSGAKAAWHAASGFAHGVTHGISSIAKGLFSW